MTRPSGRPAGYRETVGEDALYDAFDEYLRQRNQTAAKVAASDGAALAAACSACGFIWLHSPVHSMHIDDLPMLLLLHLLVQALYLISWNS